MSLKPNHFSRSRSEGVADECARIDPRGEIMKLSCWDAALYVLHRKNAISKSKFESLSKATAQDHYRDLFPRNCPTVGSSTELLDVPRGSILGFFKKRDGNYFLAHAMIYVGGGAAYGLNNGAIGETGDWKRIRLTSNATAIWGAPLSFSYEEVGRPGSRVPVEVRYRDIDDMKTPGCSMM